MKKRIRHWLPAAFFASTLILAAAPAIAKDQTPPPAPSPMPDIAKVRKAFEARLRSRLFDPQSLQITYTEGFQWGYVKGNIVDKRIWGWITCGNYNAKNRLGGYTGATKFFLIVDQEGKMTTDRSYPSITTCDHPSHTPLQPELMDTSASASLSNVADELAKLADLKSKGVLTQAEFDAQKAKLLAR